MHTSNDDINTKESRFTDYSHLHADIHTNTPAEDFGGNLRIPEQSAQPNQGLAASCTDM